MEIFRFKRFAVSNCRAAMKVNTDGVLLGATMTLSEKDRNLLDIGTGTGVIAIMAAQRLSDIGAAFHIEAIDIDGASAVEARENFASSPWACNLNAGNLSLEEYAAIHNEGFDAIFSNPPYFESSLKAPEARRREARHADTLSYREILDFAASRLSAAGRLSLILPAETELELVRHAAARGLYPFHIIRVRSTPRHPVSRIIAEFSRVRSALKEEDLIIQVGGAYSPAYRNLVHEFLLI